jgi:N-acetylmuramoyl-L-alanine amidase
MSLRKWIPPYKRETAASSAHRVERRHMRGLEQLHLARGFLTIGYNFVLFRSGRLYEGRGPRPLPAAQSGHNSGTIAIACVGDYRIDRLPRRMQARLIVAAVNVGVRRGVRLVGGHREPPRLRERTECPGANIIRWLPTLARRARLRRVGRERERAECEQDGSVCMAPSWRPGLAPAQAIARTKAE